ncbi:hypothetical protein H4687_007599 [Streptomyces stelliscabiei]|uniref:Uncharacterized protein n=1 Tax=Streptomyces stelliscabiei TaxID=146820 RepID=A0A8I0PFM9_9ACTN|nr:hypothetical protein [Streptomyces stelliscabiei]
MTTEGHRREPPLAYRLAPAAVHGTSGFSTVS